MFTKQEQTAYRAVSAPPALRTRVLAAATPRKTPLRSFVGVGTVLTALLLAVVFATGGPGPMSILLDGTPVPPEGIPLAQSNAAVSPAAMRAMPTQTVQISLELPRSTEICAQSGQLQATDADTGEVLAVGTQLTLKGAVTLRWEVDPFVPSHTLTLIDGRTSQTLFLTQAAQDGSWSLACSANHN